MLQGYARLLMTMLLLAAGCSAAEVPRAGAERTAQQPDASTGAPAQLTPSDTGSNPLPSHFSDAGQSVSADDCNKVQIDFAPRVPSVFILVDRSGSMFEHNYWSPLEDGVLAVIQQLESEIRFGFSSYTGQAGMQCPQLSTVVPIADRNYAAIKQAYAAITKPQFKAETPTSLAISEVSKILQGEPASSPKYILLVTDGEPDFCDDPNVTCSRDAVVAAAQAAYAQGIGTFIFGVGDEVDRGHLGDVANAGTGQPVVDRQMAVHYQCPNSTATYAAVSGNAPFFEPNVNDRAALVSALSSTISGVRSCVFDLQGKVKITLALADQGEVAIDGVKVPYGAPDGYRMNSETELELLGAACQHLKQPDTKSVSIDFPCKAVELL
jgi:hypothetical protein